MEDYLNLDFMTLEGISRQAGVPIDRVVYLESLKSAREKGCLFDVWREGELRGYATLKDMGEGKWFILMFVTHPAHRNRHTFMELFRLIAEHLSRVGAKTLASNVYKVNDLSVAFHTKLGFKITREAPQGYEYTLYMDSPEARKLLQWARKSMPR